MNLNMSLAFVLSSFSIISKLNGAHSTAWNLLHAFCLHSSEHGHMIRCCKEFRSKQIPARSNNLYKCYPVLDIERKDLPQWECVLAKCICWQQAFFTHSDWFISILSSYTRSAILLEMSDFELTPWVLTITGEWLSKSVVKNSLQYLITLVNLKFVYFSLAVPNLKIFVLSLPSSSAGRTDLRNLAGQIALVLL